MRGLGIAMVCCVVTARAAFADTAQDYEQRGEELARDGRLAEAIHAFKAADRLEPRANHACLIALAYIRRERWTQAELFLARCRERARPDDPLPDWLPLAEEQLRALAATSRLAAVDITVEPAGVTAAITVSSFAVDEPFAARRIRLPLGRHVITATAPGRAPMHATIEVTDTAARHVVLRFPSKPAPAAPHDDRSRLPGIVTAAGAVTLAGGLAYHLLALRPVRDQLVAAGDPENPDPTRYDRYSAEFDRRRAVTYALYGAGATAVVTGLVLRYTVYRDAPEKAPRISAHVGDGSASVAVEWHR